MAESETGAIWGEALDKLGEAARLAKEAACATLQEEGLADTRWQPVIPGEAGAIAVPKPTLEDKATSAANAVVAKIVSGKGVFPNPYKDLTNEELSRMLATAFDGKTEDGISFTEEQLGHLRSTAAQRDISAVAPDRDCTLKDMRIGR